MLDVVTIVDIEMETGMDRHVVDYAIRRYGPKPYERLGNVRLWRRGDLPRVFEALDKTAANSRIRRNVERAPCAVT